MGWHSSFITKVFNIKCSHFLRAYQSFITSLLHTFYQFQFHSYLFLIRSQPQLPIPLRPSPWQFPITFSPISIPSPPQSNILHPYLPPSPSTKDRRQICERSESKKEVKIKKKIEKQNKIARISQEEKTLTGKSNQSNQPSQ